MDGDGKGEGEWRSGISLLNFVYVTPFVSIV